MAFNKLWNNKAGRKDQLTGRSEGEIVQKDDSSFNQISLHNIKKRVQLWIICAYVRFCQSSWLEQTIHELMDELTPEQFLNYVP